jgi:hypothetical protein
MGLTEGLLEQGVVEMYAPEERKKEKHDEKCIIRKFIVFLPRCY